MDAPERSIEVLREGTGSAVSLMLEQVAHLLGEHEPRSEALDRATQLLAAAADAERDAYAARVTRTERLSRFAARLGATVEPAELYRSIVEGAADLVPANYLLLTVREPTSEAYVIRAALGAGGVVGRELDPHESFTGGAVLDRPVVIEPRLRRGSRALRNEIPDETLLAASAPFLREEALLGVLVFARTDLNREFTHAERETMPILASLAGLALGSVVEHARVADRSVRDDLTGLANRRYFEMALRQLGALRARQPAEQRPPIAAILYDIDHLRQLNAQYGHDVGDRVLRTFGAVLAARSRKADVVARHGGEEFAAILIGATRDDAMRVADEVRAAFEVMIAAEVDGAPVSTTVSAGCAEIGPDEPSLEPLMTTAEVALTVAKRAGRNTVMAA